ncbi:hypothetical protein L195_g026962, partial [Trifolium pratense]
MTTLSSPEVPFAQLLASSMALKGTREATNTVALLSATLVTITRVEEYFRPYMRSAQDYI